MLTVKVVSYHTLGPYAEYARDLVRTAKSFGVELHSVPMPEPAEWMFNWNDWSDVVAWKPSFLLHQLDKWKSMDGILYVDADATFEAYPDFSIFEGVHFSAHWFTRSKVHETEILTGTLYLANTPTIREFVSDWIDATPPFRHTFTPEQASLKYIWPKWKEKLIVKDMPPEYVWIGDTFGHVYGDRKPVILHHQASRKYRHAKKH